MNMENDLKQLEELADAATPGPWDVKNDEDSLVIVAGKGADDCILLFMDSECSADADHANAAFIAAANPARIKALCAEVRELKDRALKAEEKGEADAQNQKHIRIMYQDIVYALCNLVDRKRGWKVTKGQGVLVEEVTAEATKLFSELEAANTALLARTPPI